MPLNVYLQESQVIDVSFQYLEDVNSEFNLWQAMSVDDSAWTLVNGGGGSFGFSHSTFWLRLDVKNGMSDPSKTLVVVNYPLLDSLDFYLVRGSDVIKSSEVGDLRPFSNREIYHPSFVFRLSQEVADADRVYIRVQSQGTMVFPLELWQEKPFYEHTSKATSFYLFYFGGMFIVVLLNFAIFTMLRERIYLYYALANTGYMLFFACMRGFANQLLFPEWPEAGNQLLLTVLPIMSLFSLLFARDFLQSRQHAPKLDVCLRVMIGLELINFLCSFVLSYDASIRLSAIVSVPFFITLLIAGPIVWAAGNRAGALFTFAWSMLTLGSIITLMRFMGMLPENFITHFGMQIGSGAEAVILMIALAYRIYNEREAKISAQLASIEQAKQKRDSQEALVQAMLHDPVTKLPNRNLFEMAFNERITSQPEGDYMVFLIRIERYMDISRTLGLATGESVLQALADHYSKEIARLNGIVALENTPTEAHYLCNFSGDTFGVMLDLSEILPNSKQHLKFIDMLKKPFEFGGLSLDLNPKFGAARYPKHGHDAEELIRNAIVSIETKKTNRLGISFYSEEQDIYHEGRLTLMSNLREDLQKDALELFYQPKLASDSGAVVGMEALIRWNHEQLGFIPPDEFIPLAEETGVISRLTRWVIRRALMDFIVFREGGYEGDISVNISARNLSESDLPEFLAQCLNEFGVPANKVTLELTETAVMEDPESGIVALKALTDIGINLSIDDFGAGYSSLSYLKRLPATEIKLDRSLITDILESESDRVIVQTSIDMAHNLGYDLVAEGVETQEVLDLLKSMRCDKMQGYYLSRPLNRENMQRWLSELQAEAS
ncbi:EAL domain-containing protein [Litoribrevibacter euphylliae]|uniref:EAL domain-containing protein n=1 Tax=Litoribrevibacter euphylliae TaxID=1834034 RepID=A0ABV7HCA2_9GAMM